MGRTKSPKESVIINEIMPIVVVGWFIHVRASRIIARHKNLVAVIPRHQLKIGLFTQKLQMPVALILTQEDVSTLICADKLGNIVLITSHIGLLVELRAAVLFEWEFDIEKVFFILLPMIVNE